MDRAIQSSLRKSRMGHLEQYDIDYQYIKPCDFADAVLVQSAPNIVGIASSFAEITRILIKETQVTGVHLGTDWLNRHPICYLYAVQVASLSGVNPLSSNYAENLEFCKEWSLRSLHFIPSVR